MFNRIKDFRKHWIIWRFVCGIIMTFTVGFLTLPIALVLGMHSQNALSRFEIFLGNIVSKIADWAQPKVYFHANP